MNQTLAAALETYLRHTGGAEIREIWRDLGRQWSEAQIRTAAKQLGCTVWKSANPWPWPKLITDSDYIGNRYAGGMIKSTRKITYYLPPKAA